MKCPCHSGKEYAACCQPYHEGAPSPTPTALMRSRYSAYAMGNVDYIMETTHSQHAPVSRAEVEQFCRTAEFTGLKILEAEGDTVTFRAELGKQGGFTEKSLFAKEGDYWKYLHAEWME